MRGLFLFIFTTICHLHSLRSLFFTIAFFPLSLSLSVVSKEKRETKSCQNRSPHESTKIVVFTNPFSYLVFSNLKCIHKYQLLITCVCLVHRQKMSRWRYWPNKYVEHAHKEKTSTTLFLYFCLLDLSWIAWFLLYRLFLLLLCLLMSREEKEEIIRPYYAPFSSVSRGERERAKKRISMCFVCISTMNERWWYTRMESLVFYYTSKQTVHIVLMFYGCPTVCFFSVYVHCCNEK